MATLEAVHIERDAHGHLLLGFDVHWTEAEHAMVRGSGGLSIDVKVVGVDEGESGRGGNDLLYTFPMVASFPGPAGATVEHKSVIISVDQNEDNASFLFNGRDEIRCEVDARPYSPPPTHYVSNTITGYF